MRVIVRVHRFPVKLSYRARAQVSSEPTESTLDQIKKELADVRRKVVHLENLVNKLRPGHSDVDDEPKQKDEICVLIVDDDTDVRQFLCHLCEYEGYKVIEAERGRDALIYIEEARCDLMFLDINLRGGSGIELVRILRRQKLEIPTIVISGYVSAEITRQLLELGVDLIVAKPFNTERILGEIHELLPLHQ